MAGCNTRCGQGGVLTVIKLDGSCLKGMHGCVLYILTQLSSLHSPSATFLTLATLAILSWMIAWGGGCLVHCRVFVSILGLYPLDANRNPPSHDIAECPLAGQNCPNLQLTQCFSPTKLLISKCEILRDVIPSYIIMLKQIHILKMLQQK